MDDLNFLNKSIKKSVCVFIHNVKDAKKPPILYRVSIQIGFFTTNFFVSLPLY